MMPNHIECVDPRGIRVYCTEAIWHQKILEDHGDMVGSEHFVRETIEQPYDNEIRRDANYADRDVYYGLFENSRFYTKVVIVLEEAGIMGRLISAYHDSGAKRGRERVIWNN